MSEVYASDEKLLAKVIEIVADQLGLDADEVKPGDDLDDLGADDLDRLEISLDLEDDLGIDSIPEDTYFGWETVQQVFDYAKAHVQQG